MLFLFFFACACGPAQEHLPKGTAESPGPGTAVRHPHSCTPGCSAASRLPADRNHRVSADAARTGGKQVYAEHCSHCEKKAAQHAPRADATSTGKKHLRGHPAKILGAADAPPAPPRAATRRSRAHSNAHTARQDNGRQRMGQAPRNKRRRVPGDVQDQVQSARGRREGMSGAAKRRESLRVV